MKKLFLLVIMLAFAAATATIEAQTPKEFKKQQEAYRKEAQKVAKNKAKELKKQKWEYAGVLPLETALTNFYLETEDFGGTKKAVEHEVNAPTVSAGEKALLLNAQAIYAQEVQTMLGADLVNSTNANSTTANEEYIARVAAKTRHEFNGDISRAILLKKRAANGKGYVIQGFFLIDENAGKLRAKRIAEAIESNNGAIDSIMEKVFGEEGQK